jgi:tetratricopeptide (TPR) repeat protein
MPPPSRSSASSDAAPPQGDALRQWKSDLRAEKIKNTFYALIGLAAVAAAGYFALRHSRALNKPKAEATAVRPAPPPEAAAPPLRLQDPRLYLLEDLLNVAPQERPAAGPAPLDATWVKQAGHHLAASDRALSEGRFGMALSHLEKALAIYPDLRDVHRIIGTIHLEQRRYEEALAAFQQALEENPDSREIRCGILNNLGGVYRNLRRPAEAEKHFRAALDLDAEYLKARFNLAGLLHEENRLEEAAELYRDYLTRDPANVKAAEYFASVLIKLKRWAEAAGELEKILITEPDVAPLHFHLAQAYAQTERADACLAALRRGVVLVDSGRALAWINQPEFDPVRSSSGFQALVGELSLKATRAP